MSDVSALRAPRKTLRLKPIESSQQILRVPQVVELTGLSRLTIHRLVQMGRFPPPFKLGLRAIGWRRADLERFLAGRPAVKIAADEEASALEPRSGR